MPGVFGISLDFELMWGRRDKVSISDYGNAILGGRRAIPKILSCFETHNISASWAVVGLLYAKTKDEMIAYLPSCHNASFLDYIQSKVGQDENEDPYHFGASLIARIGQTPNQEIACHSYSHFCGLETGATIDAFKADIAAYLNIACANNVKTHSIIFPRNQMDQFHISVCQSLGLRAYRGNPPRLSGTNRVTRGLRLIDSVINIDGLHSHDLTSSSAAITNIPASRFLRPVSSKFSLYNTRHLARIKSEMTHAAKMDKLYHLWWHPHNFGYDVDLSMSSLEELINHFKGLKRRFGMTSHSMASATPFLKIMK